MRMSAYKDDLRYLYTELLKHPAFLENGVEFLEKNSKAAFEALFMEKLSGLWLVLYRMKTYIW